MELGKDDAVALSRAGHTLAYVVEDFDAGALFIERARTLNPNLGSAWYASGWLGVWTGEPQAAIEHLERFMRMSPLDPALALARNAIAQRQRRVGLLAQRLLGMPHRFIVAPGKDMGERRCAYPISRTGARCSGRKTSQNMLKACE